MRLTIQAQPLHIVADSREQAPFRFNGYPVEVAVATLEAGDYSLAGFMRRVAVERKSIQDLVGCLGADRARFERELARLRAFDAAAVVVEAPVYALRSGRYLGRLDAGAAWQSIIAFSMRYRVPILFCQDRADAEQVTFDFLRHFMRDRWKELEALAPAPTPRTAGDHTPAPASGNSREKPPLQAILEPRHSSQRKLCSSVAQFDSERMTP